MSGRFKGLRVPDKYDPKTLSDLISRLDAMENVMHSREGDVEINLRPQVSSGGRVPRFILVSPNGTRYSVLVDNAGALSTVAV